MLKGKKFDAFTLFIDVECPFKDVERRFNVFERTFNVYERRFYLSINVSFLSC